MSNAAGQPQQRASIFESGGADLKLCPPRITMQQSKITRVYVVELKRVGRGVEIRTPGLLRPRQARYQAALRPDIPEFLF
jgi:hypothetical protein